MRTIIAGSRTITNIQLVEHAVFKCGWPITEVVCGMAGGVDTLGYHWARINNVPVKEMPANWDLLGRSAGYHRNAAMAEYAEALILVWDGKSKGSGHMKNLAVKAGLKIYEKVV